MAKIKDITGFRYGRLVALRRVGKTNSGNSIWRCQCDCGRFTNVATGDLGTEKNKKGTFSCGCLKSENAKKSQRGKFWKHGHGGDAKGYNSSRTHQAWSAMKYRCNNPDGDKYEYYGGRGIKVCDRWNSDFRNFLADMGECPEGLTLERINVNGNYEPGNCCWDTRKQQVANRRPQFEWSARSGPKAGYSISETQRKKLSNSVKKSWEKRKNEKACD